VTGSTADYNDACLELVFAEARRYPLLTADQEREADRRKWAAARKLTHLFTADEGARAYLRQWTVQCRVNPPEIADFADREHHFILRRELVPFLPSGAKSATLDKLTSVLTDPGEPEQARELLDRLALPVTLTVGMAAVIMRRNGMERGCNVADALEAWEEQWQIAGTPVAAKVSDANLKTMKRLLKQYITARDTLVKHNLRLIFSIAGRHSNRNTSFADLVQEGTLGLIRAAEKYRHDKGFRFSTYSFNWISQAIRRYLGEAAEMIRYPSHVQEQVGVLHRERLRVQNSGDLGIKTSELARATGYSLDKTRYLLQLRNRAVSLDAPRRDDEEDRLLDTLAGGPFEQASSKADNASLRRCLMAELKALDPAERQVITARWGLHDGPPLTRAETADRMSISREWVRQLERSALAKLRRSGNILSAYLDYSETSTL
jgi:RNA polymerase sigma factor (sigma-70 family)